MAEVSVRIGNLEAGARWEYSLDNGANWTRATGDSFKVNGSIDGGGNTDGAKSVKIRQIDKAGNATESDVLQFNLVTRIEAPSVTDFTLGADKVQVFNQNLTAANLSSFVTASAGVNPNDTRLIIDLDGAGSGTLTYTLMLQNVVYNSINTATIFGV
ncbi:hypothetical protein RB25_20025 [Herbaspirillum rubrisubalbicans]|uniref:hypothetical protein n=1 Tax=Herbaspirillum rubrisubalbicans TaxID=80842 RepID=UPI000DC5C61D|nr:hypothetical protein [Herbaspirillum rubrisubalbicans]RAN44827.1 hypothetical protein RB25_20025 [Herbaspirillum rubrisubalbicans]